MVISPFTGSIATAGIEVSGLIPEYGGIYGMETFCACWASMSSKYNESPSTSVTPWLKIKF